MFLLLGYKFLGTEFLFCCNIMKLQTTLFGVRDSLPTARESNIFRSDCQSLCPQVGRGGLPLGSLHLGGLPRGESPSRGGWADPFPPGSASREGSAPSPSGHCSGRYASYWNAFLFYIKNPYQSYNVLTGSIRHWRIWVLMI